MIKTNITRKYPAHIANCGNPSYIEKCGYSDKSLFIADFTKQTGHLRGVEVFLEVPPGNISYFSFLNDVGLNNCYITFNDSSFTRPDGTSLKQCECVIFPETSTVDSWIFFAELKYCTSPYWNNNHINKAILQLYKTRTYYLNAGIFSKSNTCYLIASIPTQAEPFVQSVISPMDLARLKSKHNIILRLQNHVEVQDDKIINV
jgi:hypothetical protein